jgi:DNA-binding transcriptional ArsR family regulator
MSGRCIPESAWRRSYDIDDARAQVSAIYWQVSERNEHAFRFFDVIRKAIWQFSDHVRRPGKPLPICANAMQVFQALIRHMDFRTGRCDPSLDTIAATCKLSRRTVVRHLDVLRRERLIDWARRTVKTGNAPGEGPQRKQTSNAYFIDLARLPVEIVRTLRQKLGDKLRETGKNRQGSGPVPSRMQGKAAKLIASLAGNLGTSLRHDRAEMRRLAGASPEDRLAHMYRNTPDGVRQHEEMLRHPACPGASAKLALYPSTRIKG